MPTAPQPPRDGDPAAPTGRLDLSGLIDAGYLDVIPGVPPVPITVWRATGPDEPGPPAAAGGLTARLAALLIGTYTQAGDLVVDACADPAIAGAAGASGCRYLPVTALTDLRHLHGTVGLVVLGWPPAAEPPPTGGALARLLVACRRLMTPTGYTVVALAAIPPGTDYIDHARILIPAAHRAGLGYLQHIIAITTPITELLRADPPVEPLTVRDLRHARVHVDLLVLVIRHRHA